MSLLGVKFFDAGGYIRVLRSPGCNTRVSSVKWHRPRPQTGVRLSGEEHPLLKTIRPPSMEFWAEQSIDSPLSEPAINNRTTRS
jgi:hypothetical protein